MEFFTSAWEWIQSNPFLILGILLLAIVGMFAYFIYSTLIIPWRIANAVTSTIPMASDLIIHRKAIKKHATDMIDNYRNKDIDEMDLTDPDEID